MDDAQREPEADHGIAVQVANRQMSLPVEEARLEHAVRIVLEDASIPRGDVSVAVVDDLAIHELNRRYLNRDEPTDVLSFVLERSADHLEGEVIVSAQAARQAARQFGWTAADELLLYVVHGTLHLVGCDDRTAGDRARMRAREQACLARFGLQPRYDGDEEDRSEGEP